MTFWSYWTQAALCLCERLTDGELLISKLKAAIQITKGHIHTTSRKLKNFTH